MQKVQFPGEILQRAVTEENRVCLRSGRRKVADGDGISVRRCNAYRPGRRGGTGRLRPQDPVFQKLQELQVTPGEDEQRRCSGKEFQAPEPAGTAWLQLRFEHKSQRQEHLRQKVGRQDQKADAVPAEKFAERNDRVGKEHLHLFINALIIHFSQTNDVLQ